MIKRAIRFVFVFLATFSFLAHSFIPHHHHKDTICLASSHCESHQNNDLHNTNHSQSSHDHQKNSHCCGLQQAVFISSQHLKQDCECFDCYQHFNDLQSDNLSAINFWQFVLLPAYYSNSRPFKDYSLPDYLWTGLSSGLRAPPIV